MKFLFAFLGLLAGYPLSYFFQGAMVKEMVSFSRYLSDLPSELSGPYGSDFLPPVLISCVLFGVLGFLLGYFIENKSKSNQA